MRYLSCFDQNLNALNRQMTSYRMTNNIAEDFIRPMLSYHQATISFYQNFLRFTSSWSLMQMANQEINQQRRMLSQLNEILRTTRGFRNLKPQVFAYFRTYRQIVSNMISRMRRSPRTDDITLHFVSAMIPLYEGGIELYQNVIRYPIDPRLRSQAQNTIRMLQNELQILRRVRNRLIQR